MKGSKLIRPSRPSTGRYPFTKAANRPPLNFFEVEKFQKSKQICEGKISWIQYLKNSYHDPLHSRYIC